MAVAHGSSGCGKDFLHLAGYYWQCIQDLSTLTSDSTLFMWSPACAVAFYALQDALLLFPLFTVYDPTLPLSLYMDASILGLGIILSKGLGHDNGSLHMAATISPTKANYTMTELEALAIVWGTDVPPLPILSTLHLGHRSSRLVLSLLP